MQIGKRILYRQSKQFLYVRLSDEFYISFSDVISCVRNKYITEILFITLAEYFIDLDFHLNDWHRVP